MSFFSTENIGLACYLMIKDVKLLRVMPKNRGHAVFEFDLPKAEGVAHEMAYTTSDHGRFFEAFKYLRARTLRGE